MHSSVVQHVRLSRMLCHRAWIASHFHQRLQGLLFRPQLQVGEGLLLVGVKSIHTFGMRYLLDVVFLSADFTICGLHEALSRNRVAIGRRTACHALELPSGTISWSSLRMNDRLIVS